jgi:serpin B
MLVILPDRKESLRDLEAALSVPMIRELASLDQRTKVELFLPRFKITWGVVDLVAALRVLGIQRAFTQQANFSGINGYEPPDIEALFVSHVLHKAFSEVNEEGTEAAAATAVTTLCLGIDAHLSPPPVFRADHAFLFAIVDAKSGAILFLGRVADPTRESMLQSDRRSDADVD